MCLIIYKPDEAAQFADTHLKYSIDRNSDGAGVMFADNGRIITDKIIDTQDAVFNWSRAYLDEVDHIALHHRLITDGKLGLDNCHPFKVLSEDDGDEVDLYMMHNGIITDCQTHKTAPLSDTRVYIEQHLQPMLRLNHELIHLDPFHQHLGQFIGNSKLLFMLGDGTTYITNEDLGTWQEDKCWVSNTYSLSPSAKLDEPAKSGTTVYSYSKGNTALAYDYDCEPDYGIIPDRYWDSQDPSVIVDELLINGYDLQQLEEITGCLDQYAQAALIEELLERIYTKDYS